MDAGGSWRPLNGNAGYRVSLHDNHPYFSDHQVRGWKVLPGVTYLELAFIAASKQFPAMRFHLVEDMVWLRPIICKGRSADIAIETRITPLHGDRIEFRLHHDGEIRGYGCAWGDKPFSALDSLAVPLSLRDRINASAWEHVSREDIYRLFASMGIGYGPYFQRICYVRRHADAALAWLSDDREYPLGWAGLMDCAFQAGMAISLGGVQDSPMPYSLGRLALHSPLPADPLSRAFVLTQKRSRFRTDITLFNEEYSPLLSVFDLGVKPSKLGYQGGGAYGL